MWDDPLSQTTATATNLCGVAYSVTVTDANGCMTTTATTISPIFVDVSSYLVTTSAVWTPANNPINPGSSVIIIGFNFAVASGVTLTIQDMTFKFLHNASAVVNRGITTSSKGGYLILDNTTFTSNDCDTCLWFGVGTQGYPDENQGPFNNTPQGKIKLINNSLIEDASSGVGVQGGGIIQAFSSTFKNNARDVTFGPYTKQSNISTLVNCTFICDQPIKLLECGGAPIGGTINHIYLYRVNGVLITGNTFINAYNFDKDSRSTGIFSISASYRVQGNTFDDLTKGIFAISTAGASRIIARFNTFNVQQGIVTNGTTFDHIADNTFNVPTVTNFLTFGILMINSSGFVIKDNQFTGISLDFQRGVIVDNSNGGGGSIKFNTFDDLAVGTQTQLDNPLLEISCNSYTNNLAAWGINPQSPGFTLKTQGVSCSSIKKRAGNLFNDPPNSLCTLPDIANHIFSTIPFTYYGHGFPPETVPTCVSSIVTVFPCFATSPDLISCDTGAGPISDPQLMAIIHTTTDPVEKQLAINELMVNLLDDGKEQQAEIFLELLQEKEARKRLVGRYIARKEHTKARNMLAMIPQVMQEDIRFVQLHTIFCDLGDSGKTVFEMDSAQENLIRDVGASPTRVSANAQAALNLVFGDTIPIIIEEFIIQNNSRMSALTVDQPEEEIFEADIINIYPNPAKHSVTIQYYLNDNSSEIELVLYNILGKSVEAIKLPHVLGANTYTLNIKELPKGAYFCKILVDDNPLSVKKLILLK